MDRSALLERIERSWDALQDAVEDLDERQLTEPGPEGWSVKDHLAHLVRWEEYLLAALDGRSGLAALGLDDGQERDENAINAVLHLRDAGRPPAEVRRLLADTHDRVLARVRALDDAELERRAGLIEGNSLGHFDEHREWIGALVAGRA